MADDLGISNAEKLSKALENDKIKQLCAMWGYKSEIEDMRKTVSTIQAVLLDAKAKQELSNEEQAYIKQLRDVVYNAGLLFDEVVTHVEQRQQQLPQQRKPGKLFFHKVRRFFSHKNGLGQTIKARLDDIANSRYKFVFDNVDYVPLSTSEETTSYDEDAAKEMEIIIGGDNKDNHNNNVDDVEQNESNIIQRQLSYENNNERWIRKIIWGVVFNKWIYRVLNVVFEISQVALSEVNGHQKISDLLCYKIIFMISAICLLISLGEFVMEAKQSNRVVWQRRGLLLCCWFYYPCGITMLLGNNLALNFSVVSSVTQFCINLAILLSKRRFFKADYIALLFAIVAFISPMNHHPQEVVEESDHQV